MNANLNAWWYLCRIGILWVGEAADVLVPIHFIRGLNVESFGTALLFVGTLASSMHYCGHCSRGCCSPCLSIPLASGNLGLIYLTKWEERLTYEQINVVFPHLITGLTDHAWIGFVMVRSAQHGPLAIGARGIHYLHDNYVKGEDPLAHFGPYVAAHLRRTDSFSYTPDILVNSTHDPETGEVAAFEELVGSHGGLGGTQCGPFFAPSDVGSRVRSDCRGCAAPPRAQGAGTND